MGLLTGSLFGGPPHPIFLRGLGAIVVQAPLGAALAVPVPVNKQITDLLVVHTSGQGGPNVVGWTRLTNNTNTMYWREATAGADSFTMAAELSDQVGNIMQMAAFRFPATPILGNNQFQQRVGANEFTQSALSAIAFVNTVAVASCSRGAGGGGNPPTQVPIFGSASPYTLLGERYQRWDDIGGTETRGDHMAWGYALEISADARPEGDFTQTQNEGTFGSAAANSSTARWRF